MASKFYIDKSELELKEPIGRGRYGTVRTALYRRKVVAVKTMEEKDDPEFKFVVETLTNLDHENIIKCFGVGSTPDKDFIVLEYAEEGSIFNLLPKMKPSTIHTRVITMKWALQVARGLRYLHDQGIMHRDIKTKNLVLTRGGIVKICDFGTATSIDRTTLSNGRGTPGFIAPEVVVGFKYTEKVDVHSFGILLYVLWTLEEPYKGMEARAVLFQTAEGLRPSLEADIAEPFKCLMTRCWDKDPKNRPAFPEIVKKMEELVQDLESSSKNLHMPEEMVTQPSNVTTDQPASESDDEEGSSEASGNFADRFSRNPLMGNAQRSFSEGLPATYNDVDNLAGPSARPGDDKTGHPICQHDVLDGATSKEEEDSRKPLVDIFVNLIQNNGLGPSIAAFRDAQQIVVKRECPPQEILHDRQDPVSFVPNNIPRRVPPKQHAKPSW